ncbi:MAG: hypothetical protein A2675_02195 [Candidatus Yonathbacteria bacterium RIFCSPHIGHO2_01_FULL_51_10]|uniref:Uncharacterized protein n=1 Tax=Candidatus Yonathbacteria bacterium RIFCSPHIGHO2_01_FULL_51_10 TaxID=1802723 RepID=A0A1G2S707_9BACT|nr:MAG: hypothetical protein A2675_02195 [Candidatus Yonathbacteria bacterium RIFCSPHIGHO2_01_FULL_51_10]
MTNVVTPSVVLPMTDGQIDKAVDIYRALLRKHRGELGSNIVQHVLGQPEYVAEQVAVLRKRVEAVSGMIVRRVRVNRIRSPQEVLDATGRKQYTDRKVVDSMPRGEGEEVDVYLFKESCTISNDDLAKKYESLGLKPDLYAEAAINEADPAFADDHPNGSQWKDGDGKWCFAAFRRWDGERLVYVDRSGHVWRDDWWFAGVRNSLHFSPNYFVLGEFLFINTRQAEFSGEKRGDTVH